MASLLGSIASRNASLVVALFDATTAAAWVPTKPAANKAQFTGHPAGVMRGLGKGSDATEVDVGASSGFAFELEGVSGRLDAYRLGDTLAFVAPPEAWWHAEHPGHDVAALFADVLSTTDLDDATELGTFDLPSGKLAIVYLWLATVAVASEIATRVPPGGVLAIDDHGSGLVIDLAPGRYRLLRREIPAPWDDTLSVVAAYLTTR